MFCDTTIFCIEPGAGIGGIGNGFKVAPVQYPFTAFPNSLSIGDVVINWLGLLRIDKHFVNAINTSDSISSVLPFCIEQRFIPCIPLRIQASYSVVSYLAKVFIVIPA